MTSTALLVMDVHRVLTGKVFPRQANVVGIAGWTANLPRTAAG